MLNGDRSHSTKMSLKYRSLKFELNLPQMRVSFEKRHSQLGGRVKTHRTTGLIRRQEPDGENRMGDDNVVYDQRILLV